MIQWLVIDLGGVAAHDDPAPRLRPPARLANLDPATVHQRTFASGFDQRAELGTTTNSVVSDIGGLLGCSADDESVVTAWSRAFEPDHAGLDVLTTLNSCRCLFTNSGPIIDLCP